MTQEPKVLGIVVLERHDGPLSRIRSVTDALSRSLQLLIGRQDIPYGKRLRVTVKVQFEVELLEK